MYSINLACFKANKMQLQVLSSFRGVPAKEPSWVRFGRWHFDTSGSYLQCARHADTLHVSSSPSTPQQQLQYSQVPIFQLWFITGQVRWQI